MPRARRVDTSLGMVGLFSTMLLVAAAHRNRPRQTSPTSKKKSSAQPAPDTHFCPNRFAIEISFGSIPRHAHWRDSCNLATSIRPRSASLSFR
jgi:hypothetical protein